jgi:hypothetical protein
MIFWNVSVDLNMSHALCESRWRQRAIGLLAPCGRHGRKFSRGNFQSKDLSSTIHWILKCVAGVRLGRHVDMPLKTVTCSTFQDPISWSKEDLMSNRNFWNVSLDQTCQVLLWIMVTSTSHWIAGMSPGGRHGRNVQVKISLFNNPMDLEMCCRCQTWKTC